MKIILRDNKKYAKLRSFAKSVGFGLNYGIEARTLSEDHDVPVEDVEVAIDTYFNRYKKLAAWREKQGKLAVQRGYLQLPWTGRRRRFTQFSRWINSEYAQDIRRREFSISEVVRQAMNFPVQGFANEIFTLGKLKVIRRMRKEGLKSKVRISIHDGVVGTGPKHEMARVKQICNEEMTTMLGIGLKQLTLNVDFNVNEFWYGPSVTDYEKAA
jgi:DNA polymerase-1